MNIIKLAILTLFLVVIRWSVSFGQDVGTCCGQVGVGTTAPTAKLDVVSSSIRLRNSISLSTSSDSCDQGEIAWDANYVYVCIAQDTWKRAALSSW